MSSLRIAGTLVVFLLIAVFASFPAARSLDRAVTVWLQHAAPAPDLPASIFVFLGDAEIVITAAVLASVVLFAWDPRRGILALQFTAALAAVTLLAFLLKQVIPHPGPPASLHRYTTRFGISGLSPFSLPSGHTMRTTFIAMTVLRCYPAVAGALVLCMMGALVYLGDHWTTDVLAGLFLGWSCTEVARALVAHRSRALAAARDVRKP